MINAIVYKSRTDFTKEYAELLSNSTGIPCYSISRAMSKVPKGSEIIYLGWVCGGRIKGARRAGRIWAPAAICAVGMGLPDPTVEVTSVIKTPYPNIPLFYLRGGLRNKRLGYYSNVIDKMRRAVVPHLERLMERTESEDALYEVLKYGGSYMDKAYLEPVCELLAEKGIECEEIPEISNF